MKTRILISFLVLAAVAVQAVTPLEVIKDTTDKVIKIVTDPELSKEEKTVERRAEMTKLADTVFDWETMARGAMGKHWRKINDKQKTRFIPAFKELIITAYLGRIEGYSGEQVVFKGEKIGEGNRAEVKTVISTEENGDIDVTYRLHLKEEKWMIRDISVLGVNFVRNYRTQFNQIMRKGTFEELMEKINDKVNEQKKSTTLEK